MSMTAKERATLSAFASGKVLRGMILAETVAALCSVALKQDAIEAATKPTTQSNAQ